MIPRANYFPVENMANDSTSQAIVKTSEVPAEKLEKIANTVASVKVTGIKPGKERAR
jgi:hypothetical protein